jgi:DNA polymerase-1
MYFRAYIVNPSLSTNGQPIGGLKGSMGILQKLIRDINPDQTILCWDGAGGSQRRKRMNKNYKAGRKPIRLNRSIRNLTENEEITNKVWQQTRLMEYFNEMPVIQLVVDNVEADDLISYVGNFTSVVNNQIVIVSNDKDFFQILNSNTVLHRPTQKETLNKKDIIEKYGIHPYNFALARAMAGDTSDNLPGIKSVGLATVKKRFPFLAEDKPHTIQEVIDHCENVDSKLKIYQNIIDGQELIEQNYKIMQLYAPLISPQGKRKIKYNIDNADYHFNKTEIMKMMMEDGFGVYNWDSMFQNFKRISLENKS